MKSEITELFEKPHRFASEPSMEARVGDVVYHLEASGPEGIYFRKQKGDELSEAFVNVRPKKATAHIRPACYREPMMVVVDKEVITYPHTKTTIYTLIPVVIQLVLSVEGMEQVLDEQKEERVLRTHYGPVDGGVTCLLSYEPVFWREDEIGIDDEATAVVPITMVNTLEDLHTMKRIVLYSEYLDLFLTGGQLYTNPIAVHILSAKEANVDYQDKSPKAQAQKIVPRKMVPRAGRTVKQYFGQKSKAAFEYGL